MHNLLRPERLLINCTPDLLIVVPYDQFPDPISGWRSSTANAIELLFTNMIAIFSFYNNVFAWTKQSILPIVTENQCHIQKVAPGPLDLKDANDFSLWKRSRSTDCSFKLAWLSHQSVPLSFPLLRSPSISEDRVEQMDLSVASLILCGLKVRSGMLTPVLDIKLYVSAYAYDSRGIVTYL